MHSLPAALEQQQSSSLASELSEAAELARVPEPGISTLMLEQPSADQAVAAAWPGSTQPAEQAEPAAEDVISLAEQPGILQTGELDTEDAAESAISLAQPLEAPWSDPSTAAAAAADSEAAESPQPTQEAEPLLESQPAEEEGAVQATAATPQPASAPVPARMPAALLSSSTSLHHLSHPQGSSPPPKLSGAAVFCPRPCASAILEALLLLLSLLQAQR